MRLKLSRGSADMTALDYSRYLEVRQSDIQLHKPS
jgi:hypothetical protein